LIGNSLDNRLNGSAANDVLRGGAGNDTIYGNGGDDVIVGGAGSDSMRGGAGADRFVVENTADTPTSGRDWIIDFSHAEGDRIDLSGIDAIASGANDAFSFVSAFSGVAGQLIVTGTPGNVLVQGDVNGDSVADFTILVTGQAVPLVASDFVL